MSSPSPPPLPQIYDLVMELESLEHHTITLDRTEAALALARKKKICSRIFTLTRVKSNFSDSPSTRWACFFVGTELNCIRRTNKRVSFPSIICRFAGREKCSFRICCSWGKASDRFSGSYLSCQTWVLPRLSIELCYLSTCIDETVHKILRAVLLPFVCVCVCVCVCVWYRTKPRRYYLPWLRTCPALWRKICPIRSVGRWMRERMCLS